MKKEQLPLIIGLTIPVLLVVVLAAIIYVPRLYVTPQFDFVYATGSYPVWIDPATKTRIEYRVVNDRLTKKVTPVAVESDPDKRDYYGVSETTPPDFYRYDVSENVNKVLSEEEALGLLLNPAKMAPDGFEVGYGQTNENIFESVFGGRDYSQQVLTKGSVGIPLNLVGESNRYYGEFNFIGWLTQ